MTKVLGVSASLRNMRLNRGRKDLCSELKQIDSKEDLIKFLADQASITTEDFLKAGRATSRPFDEMMEELRRNASGQGLSNSESACASALWSAHRAGADIGHLSLAQYFGPTGTIKQAEHLKSEIKNADAIILSGPVYFGDRGSLAQSFIEFCQSDPELMKDLAGKIYAGLAVGAKRNGGQETTLIYQMMDFLNIGMLTVGNSSETTSQYGGTVVAGDIGKFITDDYGLNTCLGVGERIARVASYFKNAPSETNKGKTKVHLWLLQDDKNGEGHHYFSQWCREMSEQRGDVEFQLWNLCAEHISRCIACDLCPIEVGPRDDYRCIIKTKKDFFVEHHDALVDADAIMLCAYSPKDRGSVVSNYQQFIERTRYIRRDNYLFSNVLAAPFVISDFDSRQHLHIRMATSAIRHHTVIHQPIIGMRYEGELLNENAIKEKSHNFLDQAKALMMGQVLAGDSKSEFYNPIGYTISKEHVDHQKSIGNLEKHLVAGQQNMKKRRKDRLDIEAEPSQS